MTAESRTRTSPENTYDLAKSEIVGVYGELPIAIDRAWLPARLRPWSRWPAANAEPIVDALSPRTRLAVANAAWAHGQLQFARHLVPTSSPPTDAASGDDSLADHWAMTAAIVHGSSDDRNTIDLVRLGRALQNEAEDLTENSRAPARWTGKPSPHLCFEHPDLGMLHSSAAPLATPAHADRRARERARLDALADLDDPRIVAVRDIAHGRHRAHWRSPRPDGVSMEDAPSGQSTNHDDTGHDEWFLERWTQILEAIALAHHRGIHHGRLEPSQLFIVDRDVQIIGWGAPEGAFDLGPLDPGSCVAPEQREPSSANAASPATDVWSLAALLSRQWNAPVSDISPPAELTAALDVRPDRRPNIDGLRSAFDALCRGPRPSRAAASSPESAPEPEPKQKPQRDDDLAKLRAMLEARSESDAPDFARTLVDQLRARAMHPDDSAERRGVRDLFVDALRVLCDEPSTTDAQRIPLLIETLHWLENRSVQPDRPHDSQHIIEDLFARILADGDPCDPEVIATERRWLARRRDDGGHPDFRRHIRLRLDDPRLEKTHKLELCTTWLDAVRESPCDERLEALAHSCQLRRDDGVRRVELAAALLDCGRPHEASLQLDRLQADDPARATEVRTRLLRARALLELDPAACSRELDALDHELDASGHPSRSPARADLPVREHAGPPVDRTQPRIEVAHLRTELARRGGDPEAGWRARKAQAAAIEGADAATTAWLDLAREAIDRATAEDDPLARQRAIDTALDSLESARQRAPASRILDIELQVAIATSIDARWELAWAAVEAALEGLGIEFRRTGKLAGVGERRQQCTVSGDFRAFEPETRGWADAGWSIPTAADGRVVVELLELCIRVARALGHEDAEAGSSRALLDLCRENLDISRQRRHLERLDVLDQSAERWERAREGLSHQLVLANEAPALDERARATLETRLAETYHRLGDVEGALAALERADAIDGGRELVRMRLRVKVLAHRSPKADRSRSHARARVELSQALLAAVDALEPDDPEHATLDDEHLECVHSSARILADELDDPDAGIEQLEARSRARGDDAATLHLLLELHGRHGRWHGAPPVLERLAALQSDDTARASYHYAAGVIIRDELADSPSAAAAFTRVLSLNPLHEKAFSALVALHHAAKSWQAIATAIEARLAAMAGDVTDAPERLGLYEQLASVYERHLDEPSAALTAYEQGIALAPPDQEPAVRAHRRRKVMGLALEAHGSRGTDRAIDHGFELLALEPMDFDTYHHLVDLCRYAGRDEEAVCLVESLRFCKQATPEELEYARGVSRARPPLRGVLRAEQIESWLRHPDEQPGLSHVFELLLPAVANARPTSARSAGPVHDPSSQSSGILGMVARASHSLGVACPPLEFTDEPDAGLEPTVRREGKRWALRLRCGRELWARDEPNDDRPFKSHARQRESIAWFRSGRAVASCAGHRAVARLLPSATGLRDLIYAAFSTADPSVSVPEPSREQVEAWRQLIATSLPADDRTRLIHALQRLRRRRGLDALRWARGVELTCARYGLLLSGDLVACGLAIARLGDESPLVSARELVEDLLAFSVSPAYFRLRECLNLQVRRRTSKQPAAGAKATQSAQGGPRRTSGERSSAT